MLRSEDNYSLTINLPGKNQRFIPKLKELQLTNPKATLKDVVKSSQIRFWVKQRASEYNGLEVTFDVLEKQIAKFLDGIKISEEHYQEYVNFMKGKLQELYDLTSQDQNRLQLRVNGLRWERTAYINKHMGISKDQTEEEIYNDKKKSYNDKIVRLEKEKIELHQSERDTILEYEVLLDIMQRAGSYYKKANYVQKAKICNIFFLNMVLDKDKVLHIQPKDLFRELFTESILITKKAFPKENFFGANDETRTRNLIHGKDVL